ncbi:CRISPR-associated endonuclease Cas3'', partial [Chloroflexota bacterium]
MPRISEGKKQGRIDRVISLLRSHENGLTEKEIAENFSVDRKNINNYLRELEKRGRVYKDGLLWFLYPGRDIVIRPVKLEAEEAMILYLAARLFVKQSDQRNEIAENLLYKLSDILTEDVGLSADLQKAAHELVNRPTIPGYEDTFRAITQAYIYRRKVQLTYQPARGKSFKTMFAPYLLEPSAIGYATYAIGHSSIVEDLRTYKIERIKTATITQEEYTIPADFPGLEILRNAWSIFYGDDVVEVTLRFHPDVGDRVQESNWHPSQKLEWDEENPGYLYLTLEVASTTDLTPWIRGWGAQCEVVDPPILRDKMMGEARAMADLYGWNTTTSTGDAMTYYAHSRENESKYEWQRLIGHLTATSQIAAEFGAAAGIVEYVRPAALLHDLGKYSDAFQRRLEGSPRKVDHSTAGAQVLIEHFPENQIATLLAYCIAGHHTGLPDYGDS